LRTWTRRSGGWGWNREGKGKGKRKKGKGKREKHEGPPEGGLAGRNLKKSFAPL
jgi:hypothetical protein